LSKQISLPAARRCKELSSGIPSFLAAAAFPVRTIAPGSSTGTSAAFLVAVVRDMPELKRLSNGSHFGRAIPANASIATAMADMHEHLGQLIGYARTNEVVPPWSRPAQ